MIERRPMGSGPDATGSRLEVVLLTASHADAVWCRSPRPWAAVAPASSPEGHRLAWLASRAAVLNVWVRDLDGAAGSEVAMTSDSDRGIHDFVWPPDGARNLYLQDDASNENWQLREVHLDTGVVRELTPGKDSQTRIVKISKRGYAAPVGAAFTADVFRCAMAIAAPSDLNTFTSSRPPYWKPAIAQAHLRIGNPETERDFLWERSPLSKVGDIRIPLMVVKGGKTRASHRPKVGRSWPHDTSTAFPSPTCSTPTRGTAWPSRAAGCTYTPPRTSSPNTSAAGPKPMGIVAGDWNTHGADRTPHGGGYYHPDPVCPQSFTEAAKRLARSRAAGAVLRQAGLVSAAAHLGAPLMPSTGHVPWAGWIDTNYGRRLIDEGFFTGGLAPALVDHRVVDTPETRAISDFSEHDNARGPCVGGRELIASGAPTPFYLPASDFDGYQPASLMRGQRRSVPRRYARRPRDRTRAAAPGRVGTADTLTAWPAGHSSYSPATTLERHHHRTNNHHR